MRKLISRNIVSMNIQRLTEMNKMCNFIKWTEVAKIREYTYSKYS